MTIPWDDPILRVASDSPRTARYRLLQSWYRDVVLKARSGTYSPRGGPERPCGSLLHPDDVAANPDLNFLDPKVTMYAAARAAEVQREKGTLEEVRLRHNMLSSMPLCFNLFGMVRETPDAQLAFVQALFDPLAERVLMIECEWTPRDERSTINDRTAFDAAIVTGRADGTRHLIGIETKYTESFSPTRYGASDRRDSGRYRAAHDDSGWFDPDAHDRLTGSSTNQLWRNCLLAAAAERSGEFDSSEVVVVALGDDAGAVRACEGIADAMTVDGRCRIMPLGSIAKAASSMTLLGAWARRFRERYLNLEPLAGATHD